MNTNKQIVGDWLESLQVDLDAVSVLSAVPIPIATCYHCGLAVEKILKAYIIAKENKLIITHDLNELLRKCENHFIDFNKFKKACNRLTTFSTIRYPSNRKLTVTKMEDVIKDTLEIVDFTKSKLKALGYE